MWIYSYELCGCLGVCDFFEYMCVICVGIFLCTRDLCRCMHVYDLCVHVIFVSACDLCGCMWFFGMRVILMGLYI